jgi:dihydroflavonol-4-reductase
VRSTTRRNFPEGVSVVEADVLETPELLAPAFEGADALLHTAATFEYGGDAQALHRIAIAGTENVLRAAAAAGVRRAVITSSSVVFGYSRGAEATDERRELADLAGEPAYVAAKVGQHRLGFTLGERLGLEIVMACPTISVGQTAARLGPSNGLILAYLADKLRCTYPGGCNIVAAADVGAAHVLLAEKGAAGEHYLLGGENLSWPEIHAEIGRLAGVGGPNLEIGANLASLMAGAEELVARIGGRPPYSTREQAGMIGRFYWYDHGRAAALGYAPRPARQALLEALSWLVASRHVPREMRAGIRVAEDVHRFRYAGAAA